MTKISALHKKWVNEPAYKAAYDGLKTAAQVRSIKSCRITPVG